MHSQEDKFLEIWKIYIKIWEKYTCRLENSFI